MNWRSSWILVTIVELLTFSDTAVGRDWCGERLERALVHMRQRRNSARWRLDIDDIDAVYHQKLRTAPIDVSVTKLVVEV